MFEFARFFLALLAGALIGWGACAWRNGLNNNPWAANENTQIAVNTAVESSEKISAGERASSAANERVRIVVKTIEVDRECPPGRGAVSDDVAQRLRIALAQASTGTNKPAASVRGEGDSEMHSPGH